MPRVDDGDPTRQFVETRESDGSSDGLWSRIYLDGLGRIYRETREGEYRRDTIYWPTGRTW